MGSISPLEAVRAILPPSEVFEQDQPQYKEQSMPWSTHAELHPKVVLQPTKLEDMQKVVKALYESDLDFAVRNTGTGSVSAKDAILSLHGFKGFEFSKQDETVTIGAGLDWGEVDTFMEEQAPGYAVLSARCPWVGRPKHRTHDWKTY
jgi:FAD/FMN-containing dehydrogenase